MERIRRRSEVTVLDEEQEDGGDLRRKYRI